MNYSVTLYKNSGYNISNVPDTPARLAADAVTRNLASIDILQNRRLNSVLVACTNEDAEQADYIKIGSMYYAITDFAMQSVTTCLFQVVEKPLLSVGGVLATSNGGASANFSILDGVTTRCTVADDTWGAYTSEDPLTAPQEPLQLETEWLTPGSKTISESISGDPICIESLADLPKQAAGQAGVTYTDSETGESVTVPQTQPITTDATLSTFNQASYFDVDGSSHTDGTAIYITNDTHAEEGAASASQSVAGGVQAIRDLGIEQGTIIDQWRIPTGFLDGITVDYGTIANISGGTVVSSFTEQYVRTIKGVTSGTLVSTISPSYASVKNKRVLYGDYNKYGMITCAGNSAEFKPEDLGGETAPSISYKSDPRPKGKPYYRFTTINSDTDFWRNSLAGSEWENVPLVYQGASGSALTRLNFDNERAMARLSKDQYETNADIAQMTTGMQMGANAGAGLAQLGTGDISGAVSSFNNALQSHVQMLNTEVQRGQYEQRYNQQKANELSGLYQSTTVYAPTVNFPYNADILRDVKGNGVLVYKYRMSDSDVARVDKLLTMYGYKTAEPLTLSHFQRRQKFDYVACSNVTVTGDYPKWLLDDIADELKNGIRVWHTKPDASAYNDNPVRS